MHLLKYFERNYNPTKIISYADRRWRQGNLYRQLGFTETHKSDPSYFYVVNNERKHRFGYQKSKLKDKLDIFDIEKTEYENCLINNIDRIWDCGCYVFEKIYYFNNN